MTSNPLLDVLTREGVLINVSVRYWRAAKKLQAQDLGLDPDDVTDRLISLGHKRLLPKEQLAAFALIESRAHALVDANTFPFLNGLGHFLPNAKLQETTARLDALEAEFHAERARFTQRYSRLRSEAIQEWHEAARKLVANPDRMVAAIEASFPQADNMDRYFGFGVNLFQIRVPEGLEMDLVQAGDQQRIVAARYEAEQNARRQIESGVETFVGDCVASLREQTATLCGEMLVSMRDGKSGVHQRTLNRLVSFIDQFKSLNFAGDGELEARLESVRRQFLTKTAEEYRDNATARRKLDNGIRSLADAARELARSDTREVVERFGQMGVRRFTLSDAA